MTSAHTDPARRAYRLRPPEFWAVVRTSFESGALPAEIERLYDVPISTTLNRAKRERWVRNPEPPPPPAETVVVRPLRSALEVAEAALAAASEALQRGRPAEAVALIKAGDTVGSFAYFVQELRKRPEIENDVFLERREADAESPREEYDRHAAFPPLPNERRNA